MLKMDYQNGKLKEEKLELQKEGNVYAILDLSKALSWAFWSLWQSDKCAKMAAISLVSPVSYSGLIAYKFKTINIVKKGNHNQTLSVSGQGTISNATLTGSSDRRQRLGSIWSKIYITKYHLRVYDYFEGVSNNMNGWMGGLDGVEKKFLPLF